MRKLVIFLLCTVTVFFSSLVSVHKVISVVKGGERGGGRNGGGYVLPHPHQKVYYCATAAALGVGSGASFPTKHGKNVTNDVEFTTGTLIIIFSAKVHTHRCL